MKRGRPRRNPSTGSEKVTIGDDADRDRLVASLSQQLRRFDGGGSPSVDVQLLVQVAGWRSYRRWREGRQAAWVKHRSPFTAERWPENLLDGEFAVLLIPIAAGRVGLAVGRHPRTIANPLFTRGRDFSATYPDAALSAIESWTRQHPPSPIPRLAPPVIEIVQPAGAIHREVADYGLQWPLPVADGV